MSTPQIHTLLRTHIVYNTLEPFLKPLKYHLLNIKFYDCRQIGRTSVPTKGICKNGGATGSGSKPCMCVCGCVFDGSLAEKGAVTCTSQTPTQEMTSPHNNVQPLDTR